MCKSYSSLLSSLMHSACIIGGGGENRKLKDRQKKALGTLSLQGILVKPGIVNRVQIPYTPVSKAPKQADSIGWGVRFESLWSCKITSIASSIANRNRYLYTNNKKKQPNWAMSE